jgi:hypothetical protein
VSSAPNLIHADDNPSLSAAIQRGLLSIKSRIAGASAQARRHSSCPNRPDRVDKRNHERRDVLHPLAPPSRSSREPSIRKLNTNELKGNQDADRGCDLWDPVTWAEAPPRLLYRRPKSCSRYSSDSSAKPPSMGYIGVTAQLDFAGHLCYLCVSFC